jgi:hypothetical protein
MTTQVIIYTDMIGNLSLSVPETDNREDFNAIALDTQNFVSLELLGAALFNSFSTDLDGGGGTPTEQKWLDLLNGVTWTEVKESDDDIIHNNRGIKEAWKYFIYRDYLNQVQYISNFTGKAVNNSTNSIPLDRQSLNIETENRYNVGVELYRTVVEFVKYYEDFKQDYTSISEVAGTYTVLLTDTIYLKNGDKVTIDSNDYTVAGLVANTSFTFTATTGLLFSNDFVEWYPFEDVLLGEKVKLFFNGMI